MLKGELSEAARSEYVRVAFFYYKRGMTQEEIAARMKMSRQRVNRMLGECVDLGIVEIRINDGGAATLELEDCLEKKYGLVAVRVVSGVTKENVYTELGRQGGRLLADLLKDNDTIGFSRGLTLSSLVTQMPPVTRAGLVATHLMGGWNNRYNNVHGDDIVHRFAERVQVTTNMLYAPVLVRDGAVRDSIMQEPYFAEAYKVIRACNIAVLGIGDAANSTLLPAMRADGDSDFQAHGAVGEVCAHFYDQDGKPVRSSFDDRIITVQLEDLMRIPLRIGVAGLPSKLRAVAGAVRGGYVNALVTDTETAAALCGEI